MKKSIAFRTPSNLAWLAAATPIALSLAMAVAVASTQAAHFGGASWRLVAIMAVPLVLGALWIIDALGSGHILGIRTGGANGPSARTLRPVAVAQGFRLLIIPCATALAIAIL